ncbi:hypothetical protein CBP51_17535 [Cellvibrio mixtus]|uniref:Uncharacterized protein n=1 Tax=Cellvibrio mixtus TaxID=39650 RepID=A0A266Q548_9GAMM|nr:hypothetical protein [Cellvibrio mixtus]OZY84960.1 hypothetical protein CBP51_17535 [Cellvibrio mixtus]
MNLLTMHTELEILDDAMASFIADVVVSKSKKQKMRRNMECRRKLEEKWEAKKLARETCEYEFDYLH